jgi:hypothetical protein
MKGSIQFACIPGYALDPTVGASYICNNGQWSTKPRCLSRFKFECNKYFSVQKCHKGRLSVVKNFQVIVYQNGDCSINELLKLTVG